MLFRSIQGRNSVDDVDYFDHCVLEYSVDGKEWVAMMEPMEGVYDIEWRGEAVEARYVGIRKLESKKRNWLAIRSFEINPVAESEYGWDANPFTSVAASEAVVKALPEGATTVQLLLGKLAEGAYVEFLDKESKPLSRLDVVKPNIKLDIVDGAAFIAIKNDGGLIEVVFK